MNEAEWQTRKNRIDARLRSLTPAWEIIPWRAGLDVSRLERHIVTEIPTENGPADYGFFVRGQFLAILEAKKVTVNPQNVLEQAKRYSAGAFNGPGNWNGCRVPFLFASNGEIIRFLARAFRGQLVPQDPTDEPAAKLLERIRCLRESSGQTL